MTGRRTTNAMEIRYFAYQAKCAYCGKAFYFKRGYGPRPKYCSNACKQKRYRADKRRDS
jgi:hypothetical protein